MLKAPDYLSPSSIGTFQQCPLKYKFSKIDGLIDPPTEATLLGNFVHDICEQFYHAEPLERNVALAKHLASVIWDNYADEVGQILRSADKLREFRWRAWWCVENLLKMEDPVLQNFAGIETELNHDIGGVKVKGFVDRWRIEDDMIQINDYKTGKTPQPKYQFDKFDQLLIYGIILSDIHKKELSLVELLYLKDGKKISHKPSQDDIDRVTNVVMTTRKEIDSRCESEQFETKVGILCGWCNYKKICPEWSK